MELALTSRWSSCRRRVEELSSQREASGGMGAGPVLATLLLAGSVLSAMLLAPGRRTEPGERLRGLGAAGTVRGPARDVPTTPGAQDLSEAPGPLWGGHRGSPAQPGFPGSVAGARVGCSVRLRIHRGKGVRKKKEKKKGILGVPSTPRVRGPATPFHKLLSEASLAQGLRQVDKSPLRIL